MTTIAMNGVSATLTFHDFDDFYRWELVLSSGENYARIDGIIDDSKHSLKFNGEEAKLEFHKMAILCPHQCFKDYLSFKPDIADRTERISTYLANDWHKDSVFAIQISWMKSACKKHSIEFELEMMRDFFKCTKPSDCTYVSMDAFVKTLTKSDHDHIEYIIKLIAECQTTTDKKEKGEICIRIYEYLLHKALHYVKKTPKLKAVTIRKAYELKLEGIPELTQIIDDFLTAIGEPSVPSVPSVPIVEYCSYCDDCDSDDCDSDDGYFDTWTQCIEDPYLGDKYYRKGGPCDQEKARSKLMQDIFKKEELTFTCKVMPLYYEWAKTNEKTAKANRYKKMCLFIDANRHTLMEHDVRKSLMQSLFKKKNLKFYNAYMNDYYEWEKDCPKMNRYKKMCLFIEQELLK